MEIQEKIEQFAPTAEHMPGVVVVHRINGFAPLYMNSTGLELLDMSLEQLIDIGEDYQKFFFNEEFMDTFLCFLQKSLCEKENGDTYNLFHQVQLKRNEPYRWYISSLKVFHSDATGNPTHTVTIAFPLCQLEQIPMKAEKMLREILFHKRNQKNFLSLGDRAKEVLRLVALGKSSAEIANELHVTVDTVNSHKKLVKHKLKINSAYQFTEYARSFDLI